MVISLSSTEKLLKIKTLKFLIYELNQYRNLMYTKYILIKNYFYLLCKIEVYIKVFFV